MNASQRLPDKRMIPAKSLLMMCFFILHTAGYLLLSFYPIELYLLVAPSTIVMIFLCMIEKSCPILKDLAMNLICGLWGPLCLALIPEFSSIGYSTHFIGFIFIFFVESSQYSVYFLLGSNFLGWSVCFYYYMPALVTGAQMPPQIQFFFGSYHSLVQLLAGITTSCAAMAVLDKEKRRLARLQDQYKSNLLQLNEDLKKSNATLEQTNKTLQETLAEKESFILRFSHEIRNPLNSLLGNVELCHESSMLCQEDRKMLQDAKISGEILLQLLNNILDSAKISTKRLEINIQLYDIREFCENLWITCSDIIGKAKLFGSLAINFNVPRQVEFDELRMRQIVMNLLTNATKFTQHGFISTFIDFVDTDGATTPDIQDMKPRYFGTSLQGSDKILLTSSADDFSFQEFPSHKHDILTLNTKKFRQQACLMLEEEQNIHFKVESYETRPLKVCGRNSTGSFISSPLLPNHKKNTGSEENISHTVEREGYLRIEIVDSGCGIKEEDLKNVFNNLEKNKAAVAAPTDRQIGAGLGLWITKELVELMGGKIEIYSKSNVGTCVVIMIKSRSEKNSPRQDESRSLAKFEDKTKLSHEKRVLIVEDIVYNQEVNRKLIQKCGINHISIANNGLEALELFQSKGDNYFDAILTDLDMPIMDGKTSIKLIREHERKLNWKPVKIIILTGYSEAITRQEMLNPNGSYRANAFLSKPSTFESILKALNIP